MMNDVNTHSTAAFQSLNDINWTTQQPNETMKMQFSFPAKLYNLLETSDKSIIDWLPNGKAFRVYDLDKFVEVIMPTYFKQSKFGSFQRQLNIYGFKRILRGYGHGAYFNQNFERGRLDLLVNIKRVTSRDRDDSLLNAELFGIDCPSDQIFLASVSSDSRLSEPFSPMRQGPPSSLHVPGNEVSPLMKRKRVKKVSISEPDSFLSSGNAGQPQDMFLSQQYLASVMKSINTVTPRSTRSPAGRVRARTVSSEGVGSYTSRSADTNTTTESFGSSHTLSHQTQYQHRQQTTTADNEYNTLQKSHDEMVERFGLNTDENSLLPHVDDMNPEDFNIDSTLTEELGQSLTINMHSSETERIRNSDIDSVENWREFNYSSMFSPINIVYPSPSSSLPTAPYRAKRVVMEVTRGGVKGITEVSLNPTQLPQQGEIKYSTVIGTCPMQYQIRFTNPHCTNVDAYSSTYGSNSSVSMPNIFGTPDRRNSAHAMSTLSPPLTPSINSSLDVPVATDLLVPMSPCVSARKVYGPGHCISSRTVTATTQDVSSSSIATAGLSSDDANSDLIQIFIDL